MKHQDCCTHVPRAQHCSGAHSHHSAPNPKAPDALGFVVSSKLILLTQPGITAAGMFSQGGKPLFRHWFFFGILLWDIIETICKITTFYSYCIAQELQQQRGNETFQSQLIWIVSVIKTFQEGQRKTLSWLVKKSAFEILPGVTSALNVDIRGCSSSEFGHILITLPNYERVRVINWLWQ